MEGEHEAELCYPELNTSCRKPLRLSRDALPYYVLITGLSLLTVVLNLLVIIAVSHFRQLHTPSNLLLLSLAVSDFLVGLFLMPGEILRFTSCWFLGDLACALYNFISFVLTSSSVGDLVLISLDRYCAICNPLHYSSKITMKRVTVCVCLCWFCSVVVSSFYVEAQENHTERVNSCLGQCVIVVNFVTGTFDMVVTFILPVTAIFILYFRVFIVALTQARAMRSNNTSVHLTLRVSVKKSELKAARTLGVLIVVYLLCFCPYYSVSISVGDEAALRFALYLFGFNSCVNPIIYAMFYPWFRKAVKLIVTLEILKLDSCQLSMT